MKNINLYSTVALSMGLLVSGAIQAGEGVLALTTDPRDADIYVDGQLKVNTTPVIFRLLEGKYQIEIKSPGKRPKQLEVLIAKDAIISKRVTLLAEFPQMVTSVAFAEDIKDFAGFEELIADNKISPPCTTCHKLDTKLVGPSYNAVALHYKGNAEAAALLEKKIVAGGSGTWGVIPMTTNPTAKDQVATIVKWILSLNPEGDAKANAEEEIAAMP